LNTFRFVLSNLSELLQLGIVSITAEMVKAQLFHLAKSPSCGLSNSCFASLWAGRCKIHVYTGATVSCGSLIFDL